MGDEVSNGIKAMILLGGLFGFFGLAVCGSLIEQGAGNLARDAMIYVMDDSPQRVNKTRIYKAAETRIAIAHGCCTECEGRWDYALDRCEIVNQSLSACIQTCGGKSE